MCGKLSKLSKMRSLSPHGDLKVQSGIHMKTGGYPRGTF